MTTQPTTRRWISLAFVAIAPWTAARGDEPATSGDFFEQRIRPVLVRCATCHGQKEAKAGLRLDSRAALLRGSEGGPVVEVGDPDASLLIDAVRRDGPVKMPPKKAEALDSAAVADLTRWIRMGLPWPEPAKAARADAKATTKDAGADAWREHWAYRPVANPSAPSVERGAWIRSSIDPFVLAPLEARGLAPSPEADRVTWIRRVTFDLTGLPPTAEEVAAFRADTRPDAHERLVDRLLASPHFGERWGRLWLDVARYADTKGYVFFEDANFPWAFTYRDYVVDAFNSDLPFDRFVLEQLAADRLPRPSGRSLAALGFVSLGGRFMNNPHDIIDDRIDAVTRGLMGLTVGCARCHDHKYDPVPSTDYYALYGIFASTTEPSVPPTLDPPPDTPEYRAFAEELRKREEKLAEFVDGKRAALAAAAKTRAAEYLLAAQAARDKPSTEDFMLLADGNDLNPTMIVRWQAYLERTRRGRHPVFAPWHALAALPAGDFAARAGSLIEELASTTDPARAANPKVVRALVESSPRSLVEVAATYARILNNVERVAEEHDRRATLEGRPAGPLPDLALEQLRQVFHGPDAPPDIPPGAMSNLELLPDRPAQATLQQLEKAVETWRVTGKGAPVRVMAMVDLPKPIEPRVFLRGNPNNPGATVPRRFLAAFAGAEAKPYTRGSGRLELARAIVDPDNPLTARVLVNRIWAHHMGAPLVNTPGDFGLRSDPPSNPALLDHLAHRLMREDRWSLKALHRRIVLSATYRQSSGDRPDARAVDPENKLLARMNRRRIDFESLRDALLAASGRLERQIGGRPFDDVASPASRRRTLYGKIDRLNLPGLYRTFDFPDPNATSPQRDATTVAPQALFLMNHPFTRAAAKALLARGDVAALPEGDTRLARIHQILFGRDPSPAELALARRFVSDPDGGWELYAQALLLSNEFVFID